MPKDGEEFTVPRIILQERSHALCKSECRSEGKLCGTVLKRGEPEGKDKTRRQSESRCSHCVIAIEL